MATFFMFGSYSTEALKALSVERTGKVLESVKRFGGEVRSIYALLGEKDLVLILDLPSAEQAMKVSVALHKLTGISFTTSPAVQVEEFDRMMREV